MRTIAHLYPNPKPNHKHWYAYNVVFDGDLIITDSRDPEHDLARALLARGVTGTVTLHDGNTGKPRTIINIEKTAQWSVGSNLDRYRWKAPGHGNHSSHTGEEPLVLPTFPTEADEAA